MASELTQKDCMELLRLIKEQPNLYNRDLRPAPKQDDKDRIWSEISEKMKIPVKDLKDRWQNLRTAYVKDLQKTTRSYQYRYEMEFLTPHVRSKKCQQLLSPNDVSNDPSSTSSDNMPVANNNKACQQNETSSTFSGVQDIGEELQEKESKVIDIKPFIDRITVVSSDEEDIKPHTAQLKLHEKPRKSALEKTSVESQVKKSILTSENKTPKTRQNMNNSNTNDDKSCKENKLTIQLSGDNESVYKYPISSDVVVPGPSHSSEDNRNCGKSLEGKTADKLKASKGIKRKKTGSSQQKKKAIEGVDPREQYLLSVLPDIQEMTHKQMRIFRKKVSDIIHEIMDECEGDSDVKN